MRQRSRSEFERIYEAEVFSVYGFIAYRVRSRPEAEDLTQMTFERALNAWDRFDPARGSARGWLFTIARNLVIDHLRSGAAAEPVELESAAARHDGALITPALEESAQLGLDPALESALASLSSRERELIALRFGAELNGPEIAVLTELSVANVQQILSRSLRKLHAKLDPP